MRTLTRVSAAFLLLDVCDKQPLMGASILVDGERKPFISKGDGHYVFINLEPISHEYEISAPGFRPVKRNIPFPPGVLPFVLALHYDNGGEKIKSMPYFKFVLRAKGKLLKNTRFSLTMESSVPSLRVIENAEKGASFLKISSSFQRSMLYQEYICSKDGRELMIMGYNWESGMYELQKPLEEAVQQGSLLKPRWNLETDEAGVVVLPVIGSFIQKEEIEFSARLDKKEQKIILGPSGPGCEMAKVDF